MRRFAIGLMMALAALLSHAATAARTTEKSPNLLNTHIVTAPGKDVKLTLEMATTPAEREHGLMNRSQMGAYDGMAFFFPKPAIQKFWMKNTLIPLDMLFVNEAGMIIYITTATPLSLEAVGPDQPVATVIELAGGRAKEEHIAVNDKVTYALKTSLQPLAR